MPSMSGLLQEHSDHIDSILSEFTDSLDKIIQKSSRQLFAELRDKLAVTPGGRIRASASNQKTIARVDTRFMALMDENGYSDLLERYTGTFGGQFEWFTKVIEQINSDLVWPLNQPSFSRLDMAELDAYKLNAQDLLRSVVERVSAKARTRSMISTGGLSVRMLTDQLADTFSTSMAESQTLAETSIATFYRTITDKGFQAIEKDLPGFDIRYNYEGPLDKLTRPFCTKLERLAKKGQTWTRAEIDKMNNGQIPNVFTTGGGYRCRHQWVISTRVLAEQQRTKIRPKDAGAPTAPTKDDIVKEISATRKVNNARFKRQTGAELPHKQIADLRNEMVTKIRAERSKR
jgi:hypothetical protein